MPDRPRFSNPFASEEAIAALIRATLELQGWEVHPECNGWDLFAVAREARWPAKPGDTLGVECKLDAGRLQGFTGVLRQAMPRPAASRSFAPSEPPYDYFRPPRGPHFRAVASARVTGQEIFRALGIAVWEVAHCPSTYNREGWDPGEWRAREVKDLARLLALGHRFEPVSPPPVPEVVLDVPAGVPSPQISSPWKIAAVRLMLRLLAGEEVTSQDFDAAGVRIERFRNADWIVDSGRRRGRFILWAPGDPGEDARRIFGDRPDRRWPQLAEALMAKDRLIQGGSG